MCAKWCKIGNIKVTSVTCFNFIVGWPVTEQQLQDVAEMSEVLEIDQDFVESEFRIKCERAIPFPEQVEPDQCADAYIYLKDKYLQS